MAYQVLALKWRPQAFDAVVGQDAITRTLRNALASGRVAHAYLLAGPRGVGKTTTARLLARALLCPERTGPEACGRCAVCAEAQGGAGVDVIEIDAASNRGIDEIRALRENVKYAPARGRYKVYIIDEVHQLTAHAFDALLKTLEEPPPHVVFILATTDPRDIPATVLSRVQRFDFRPISPETLTAALERILAEEAIPFEPAALPVVVRAAEGSLRDALSLLDTAIAYGSGRLEAATAAELLGATAPAEVAGFARALVGHDTVATLETIDRVVRDGGDLGGFVRDAIEVVRLALVLKAAPSTRLADLPAAEAEALRALGAPVSVDELLYVLRALLEADAGMRESPHPRVELEIAAVRATRRPVPEALDAVLARVDEVLSELRAAPGIAGGVAGPAQAALLAPAGGEAQGTAAPRGAGEPRATDERRPAGGRRMAGESRAADEPRADAPPGRRAGEEPRAPAGSRRPGADGPAPAMVSGDLAAAWERVVDEVMRKKPTVGAVLGQARPEALRDGELTIAVAGNHFHQDLLADRANREFVLQAVRRHLDGVERLAVSGERPAGDDVTSHPAVQAAIAEFEGEVVAVRPRPPEGEGQ
jgi:DNA polymerase III subunit gamma/tau